MKEKHLFSRRQWLQLASAAALTASWRGARAHQTSTILVGFPVGGAIDVTARLYAEAMSKHERFVIENKAGAAGNIAAGNLAQRRADGQSLMFAPVNVYCISQSLYTKLPFDAARDFAPLGIVAQFPWALAVNPSIPVNTLDEFVQWIKEDKTRALCGMAAVGSEGHLMAYAFARAVGIELEFVAYQGGAPMAQDLMAGHIPFAFDPVTNLAQAHLSGKLRILAMTGEERSALLPHVATFAERGYPMATGSTWIGAAVRTGTSQERRLDLQSALQDASSSHPLQTRLSGLGLTVSQPSMAVMAETIRADTQRYTELVKAIGLKIA